MKLYTFISFLLIMSFTNVRTQVETLATIQINGNGKAIFLHDHTGIPIIQATDSYTAIHPVTHEKIWEIERSSTAAMIEAGDTSGEGPADYADIYQTPFAYVNGNIINVQTGQLVIDGEKDEIKRFMEFYIVMEADLLLLQLGAKGKIRLYGIDPFTSELKWSVDLRDMSGLAQQVSADLPNTQRIIPPLLTSGGDLLYHNAKNLASINLKSGSLNWNEKLNPGYIFINDDATKLLVVEKKGAIGGAMTITASPDASPSKFSKKLYLIDAASGKSLWSKGDTKMEGNIQFIKPYDGGYMVIHDEGFNIYDYHEGKKAEGRWKKDISFKKISDVEILEEGLMVYFKNRRMLVDPKSGDELWKKDEKLERERKFFNMSSKGFTTNVGNARFYTQGGNLYISINNGFYNPYRCDTYVVDEENMQLIIARIGDPDAIYVGDIRYDVFAIDLMTGKVSATFISIRKHLSGVDAVKGGYFFYNDRGYRLMGFENKSWSKGKKEYYPDPSRGERLLKGMALAAIRVNASARNVGSALISNDPNAAEKYMARQDAINSVDASGLYTRKKVGRVEDNFAYFFSRNDDGGDLTLFKVDKNTGEEVKEYPFDDNSPIYEIDSWNDQLYYLVDDQLKVFGL